MFFPIQQKGVLIDYGLFTITITTVLGLDPSLQNKIFDQIHPHAGNMILSGQSLSILAVQLSSQHYENVDNSSDNGLLIYLYILNILIMNMVF